MKKHMFFIVSALALGLLLGACGGGSGSGPSPSSDKAITAYSFVSPAATGVIDEAVKTIAVTVPFGTNVTTLVATFTATGESVKVGSAVQVSGTTPNNFTNPVTYVVTAADGATATYTVTVTVAPSSAKAITAYSFTNPASTGTINESAKTISVTVPFGTNVTALVATFTTTGESVKVGSKLQASGTTPNNFTNPVTYVVTAADGATATYTVTVTVAPSSAKAITAYSLTNPASTGTIDESAKTISVTVPNGTNVTALVATFTATGESVKVGSKAQVSGTTANDFRNPVAYAVTAADSTTATYTVTVTVHAGVIAVPRTGQVVSYSTTTTQDDGALQKGASWPSPRFTENGDGTVADNLTGLVWLKDANCMQTSYGSFDTHDVAGDGAVNWQPALDFIAGINAGTYSDCGAGKTDWRLPNMNELRSLIDYGRYDLALPAGHPFVNVQGDNYWSSTTDGNNAGYAFSVSMHSGWLSSYAKDLPPGYLYFVWPVRTGQTKNALTNIPRTGQVVSYSTPTTYDDGALQKGVAWPSPRFTENGDGTVADRLTGLVWLKDANCMQTNYGSFDADSVAGDGSVKWQHALDFIAGINAGTYSNCGAGKADWRLPNANELLSLAHEGYKQETCGASDCFSIADWLNNLFFTNVQATVYWTSTTYSGYSQFTFRIEMTAAGENVGTKNTHVGLVWPVRGGQ